MLGEWLVVSLDKWVAVLLQYPKSATEPLGEGKSA